VTAFVLSQAADDDLVAIWVYVFEFECSDRRADRTIRSLYKSFEKVAKFPKLGRPRPSYGPDVLSFPSGRWVIYFRRIDSGIEIIRVTGEEEDVLPQV
jgi:toxin ParE1/3/4